MASMQEGALYHQIELLQERNRELEAKLATCKKYRDAYAECDRIATQAVCVLEAKLAKAVDALATADKWLDDLDMYADQYHDLVPSLQKVRDVYRELKREDKDL